MLRRLPSVSCCYFSHHLLRLVDKMIMMFVMITIADDDNIIGGVSCGDLVKIARSDHIPKKGY